VVPRVHGKEDSSQGKEHVPGNVHTKWMPFTASNAACRARSGLSVDPVPNCSSNQRLRPSCANRSGHGDTASGVGHELSRVLPLDQVGVLAALVEAASRVGWWRRRPRLLSYARMLTERPAAAVAEISASDGGVAALADASVLPHRSGVSSPPYGRAPTMPGAVTADM
jgi:hypothetical protein